MANNDLTYVEKLKELKKEVLINSIIEEKEKNARISFALKATEAGIWEWNTATNEIFMSSECFAMLGYDSPDIVYPFDWFQDKTHENDRIDKDVLIEEHVKSFPYNKEFEYRMEAANGEYVWVRSIGKVKNTGIDDAPILIGTIDNINRRKKLEKELVKYQKHLEELVNERTGEIEKKNKLLSERERAYSTLLQNMQGMAYRYNNDADWTLLYVSEGCEELTGFTIDEFRSMEVRMETHVLYKDYADPVWKEIVRCLDAKDSFKVSYPIKTKQGIDKWVLDRGRGVYDEEGKLVFLEGVIVDITEQKNQELKYKLAQETMDKAPIAIMWIQEDGTIQYVNDVMLEYSGYTRKELEVLKIFDIDPSLDQKTWQSLFEERMNKEIKDAETVYTSKNGAVIPVLVNATNIEYEGEVLNCSFINEISEIKKARMELQSAYDEIATSEEELRQRTEELNAVNDHLVDQKNKLEEMVIKLRDTQDQLVQAEKMASLGVLVAGIAHEINNPINYISTGADALQMVIADVLDVVRNYSEITSNNYAKKLEEIEKLKKEVDFDDLLEDLERMGENINVGAEQASEIVRGLRSFSRMDGGELSDCNIHQIIDNVLLMLYNNYKYRIKLTKSYSDIPQIEGYPSKLSQVFMNLLTNAIQAIDGEGEITISTYKEKDNVIIEVKDTGKGISEELRSRIFEPFFTTKDTGSGTGLGLSITLGIIEDHYGKIELQSIEGKGTTFLVVLPVKRPSGDK